MPDLTLLNQIADWCATFIQAHPALSVFGLIAMAILMLVAVLKCLGWLLSGARVSARALKRRKRQEAHGFGIVLSQLSGPAGGRETKAMRTILDTHLSGFTFGAPYDVSTTKPISAKGRVGLRDLASRRLDSVSGDLISWGRTRRKDYSVIDLMTRDIDPETGYGRTIAIELPERLDTLDEVGQRAVAYLFARIIQPGLAEATGFRPEKVKPIALMLQAALDQADIFPAETAQILEEDYCAMALHVGDVEDLERVVTLRRARLMSDDSLDRRTQVTSRIDLGRALLSLSERKFDPTRIREAMDHLKQAVDLLREHPAIRLATATSDAVRQGEKMLASRRKFSVTGGSAI